MDNSQQKFSELCGFQEKQLYAAQEVMTHIYTLYGGAAGGGKSYWLRWMMVYLCMYYAQTYGIKNGRVGLFCEDYPSLEDRQLSKIPFEFPPWLGTLNKSSHEFKLNDAYGGWTIAFRNLDDVAKYLSAEFAAIGIDELTRNLRERFDFLIMRRRWPGIPPNACKFLGATNPGQVGHGWVKKLWIDRDWTNEPKGILPEDFTFIKARAVDNKFLGEDYANITLAALPEQLQRAYRDGDWDVFAGQYFTEFNREVHVIEPFTDKNTLDWFNTLPTFCGLDYGYTKPSCVLWGKVHDDTWYIYREYYSVGKTYTELRDIITALEVPELIYADPSIWAKKDSPRSGADDMKPLPLRAAMNDRVIGWTILKTGLKNVKIKIFNTCSNLIRTFPLQVYTESLTKVEDLDTNAEDHAVDAARYLIASHKSFHKQVDYTPPPQQPISDLAELFPDQDNKIPFYIPTYGRSR